MTDVVAVAGPPNTGKTTLFNRLTGASLTVGNWPGQTVERHSGSLVVDDRRFELVDLPGTYGLVAISAEESIATSFLIETRPDVVVTVVDATSLESGLHLVSQIAEAGFRQVVAINMSDVAERRGVEIDYPALSLTLGVPVVPTVARRGGGLKELRQAIAQAARSDAPPPLVIDYGAVIERHLGSLTEAAVSFPAVRQIAAARWTILQLLAGDGQTRGMVERAAGGDQVLAGADQARTTISSEVGVDVELALAERRFRWVLTIMSRITGGTDTGRRWSDRFDTVLTHRVLGLPVFLAVMWVVLRFTADVTAPYLDWVDSVVSGPIARWSVSLLGVVSLDGTWVEALVVDGILAGVGGVLIFVPVLFGLYLMLGLLEDSGYMARAATVMDRMMRAIGIPGKAFLPMMVGFGCTVPAIYATRTLDSARERLLTGLLTPFMSCGARLPVYILLAGVFFAGSTSTVVFSMYMLGIAVAVLIGFVLSRTVLREEEPNPFVMVLPEFRRPNARTVWSLVRQRTWEFIKGAGTIILVASIAVWLLLAIPLGGGGSFAATDAEDSAFGGASRALAPVMDPLGFGEWEQSGALLTGFVAKEVVVSTMAQLYAVEDGEEGAEAGSFVDDLNEIGTSFVDATADTVRALPGVVGLDFLDLTDESSTDLQDAIRTSFEDSSDGRGALAGLAFLVFVLLYTPCMAAVAAFRHEFGTRWMWVSVVGQFGIAWLGAFIVYQGGRLVGLG